MGKICALIYTRDKSVFPFAAGRVEAKKNVFNMPAITQQYNRDSLIMPQFHRLKTHSIKRLSALNVFSLHHSQAPSQAFNYNEGKHVTRYVFPLMLGINKPTGQHCDYTHPA